MHSWWGTGQPRPHRSYATVSQSSVCAVMYYDALLITCSLGAASLSLVCCWFVCMYIWLLSLGFRTCSTIAITSTVHFVHGAYWFHVWPRPQTSYVRTREAHGIKTWFWRAEELSCFLHLCWCGYLVLMAGHHAESYPYIRSLVEHLNSVRPGSFANGGAFQLPLPALKINGVEGVVGLPASDAQAKAIMAVCSQASYGRGEETIVDTSVRNTWQLDPAHFTIMNPKWNTGIKNLTTVVERELGCDPSLNVRCELSKFLLYEQGSFFKVCWKTMQY